MLEIEKMPVLLEMAEILRAPDALDRSSGLEQLERASSIAAIQARLQGEGREDCLDCGFDIPAPRRKAVENAVRCKPCQDYHDEREARRYG